MSVGVIHLESSGEEKMHSRKNEELSIIVYSHLRWDFVWQRPQQIFSRLAAHYPILFVEEPLYEAGGAQLRIVEAQPNVLRAIPVLPAPVDADAVCTTLLPLLREAIATHPVLGGRFERVVQWFYSPMCAPAMMDQLDELAVVYDCMDELANFRFAPKDIAAREARLLERADVVFTGGYQLYEAKSQRHTNVHFFGCGVDLEHFGQARLPHTVVPESVASLPGPVLGYFGVIDERLDYELIDSLARAFSRGSVVMAGPLAKVEQSALPQHAGEGFRRLPDALRPERGDALHQSDQDPRVHGGGKTGGLDGGSGRGAQFRGRGSGCKRHGFLRRGGARGGLASGSGTHRGRA
jgi:hypothetical protein